MLLLLGAEVTFGKLLYVIVTSNSHVSFKDRLVFFSGNELRLLVEGVPITARVLVGSVIL